MGTESHSKATSDAQEAGVPLEVLVSRENRFQYVLNLPAQAYFDSKLSSDASPEDVLAFLDQTKTDYAVHEQLAIVIHKVCMNPSILRLPAANHERLAIYLARWKPRCRGLEPPL